MGSWSAYPVPSLLGGRPSCPSMRAARPRLFGQAPVSPSHADVPRAPPPARACALVGRPQSSAVAACAGRHPAGSGVLAAGGSRAVIAWRKVLMPVDAGGTGGPSGRARPSIRALRTVWASNAEVPQVRPASPGVRQGGATRIHRGGGLRRPAAFRVGPPCGWRLPCRLRLAEGPAGPVDAGAPGPPEWAIDRSMWALAMRWPSPADVGGRAPGRHRRVPGRGPAPGRGVVSRLVSGATGSGGTERPRVLGLCARQRERRGAGRVRRIGGGVEAPAHARPSRTTEPVVAADERSLRSLVARNRLRRHLSPSQQNYMLCGPLLRPAGADGGGHLPGDIPCVPRWLDASGVWDA